MNNVAATNAAAKMKNRFVSKWKFFRRYVNLFYIANGIRVFFCVHPPPPLRYFSRKSIEDGWQRVYIVHTYYSRETSEKILRNTINEPEKKVCTLAIKTKNICRRYTRTVYIIYAVYYIRVAALTTRGNSLCKKEKTVPVRIIIIGIFVIYALLLRQVEKERFRGAN